MAPAIAAITDEPRTSNMNDRSISNLQSSREQLSTDNGSLSLKYGPVYLQSELVAKDEQNTASVSHVPTKGYLHFANCLPYQ